jgi:hypothetical protein
MRPPARGASHSSSLFPQRLARGPGRNGRAAHDSEPSPPPPTDQFANRRERESGAVRYPLCFNHLQSGQSCSLWGIRVCCAGTFWSNP